MFEHLTECNHTINDISPKSKSPFLAIGFPDNTPVGENEEDRLITTVSSGNRGRDASPIIEDVRGGYISPAVRDLQGVGRPSRRVSMSPW